jgi:hypothetical protein
MENVNVKEEDGRKMVECVCAWKGKWEREKGARENNRL